MAMAGPDELDGIGLKLDLPRPRHKKLGDYKVALWMNDAIAPVSKEFKIASSLSVKRSRQPAEWSIMGLDRISMRRRRMASSSRFYGRLWPREPPMRILKNC